MELAVVCGRGRGCRVLVADMGISGWASDSVDLYSFEGVGLCGAGFLPVRAALERAARAAGREPVRDRC